MPYMLFKPALAIYPKSIKIASKHDSYVEADNGANIHPKRRQAIGSQSQQNCSLPDNPAQKVCLKGLLFTDYLPELVADEVRK